MHAPNYKFSHSDSTTPLIARKHSESYFAQAPSPPPILIYGQRPRLDMLRVMLADLGLSSRVAETLLLDSRFPILVDSEVLTTQEKTALQAVKALGTFRQPLFILDNTGQSWPSNLEILGALDDISQIPKILHTYEAHGWTEIEANLRRQTARRLKIGIKPAELTELMRVFVLTDTTANIPGEIGRCFDHACLNITPVFSPNEANHKAEKLYGEGLRVDGILNLLTDSVGPVLENALQLTVQDFSKPYALHGKLLGQRNTTPISPSALAQDVSRFSPIFTHSFSKHFWKAHAKQQLKTYDKLGVPLTVMRFPVPVEEEGRLMAHLYARDFVGRISRSHLAVVFVGHASDGLEKLLDQTGFAHSAEFISATENNINRL